MVDEFVTTGRQFFPPTAAANPHDWLQNMGGSIGFSTPVATGAAIACPDRKVICMVGDGSAMYTLQSLWTQAREGLNVLTIVFANRIYQILRGEFDGVGAGEPGQRALDMLKIDRPTLDWVSLAMMDSSSRWDCVRESPRGRPRSVNRDRRGDERIWPIGSSTDWGRPNSRVTSRHLEQTA